jgi:hypothetical protein
MEKNDWTKPEMIEIDIAERTENFLGDGLDGANQEIEGGGGGGGGGGDS